MCAVKLMVYPDWMIKAMRQNNLSFEIGTNLKSLEGIVSVRDLIIYTSINSLHFHEVMDIAFGGFSGVRPGFELDEIEPYFAQSHEDSSKALAYRDLSDQIYSPDVLGSEALAMLHDSDHSQIRLAPEVIIGDTVHACIVPTALSKEDATQRTLEDLLQLINDESPIVMENTALFKIYHTAIQPHAA